jgi:pimeloyl-ACP methyl ester carboxylesterase
MEQSAWPRRLRLAAAVLGGLALLVFVAVSWHFSNVLQRDLLTPLPFDPDPDLQVLSVGEGRIVLPRTELTARDGVWGLVGPSGYGQVANIVEGGETEVERAFLVLEGTFDIGDAVFFDQYAFAGDPFAAHALSFEEVRVAGETGVLPAWFVPADRDTWVVFVHGKGLEERRQVLRILPTLHELELPVLAITYRNDEATLPSETGRYGWGYPEWRDVQAALEFADLRGADDFVLMASSMGGAITATYLNEAHREAEEHLIDRVRAVVWDSPVLDLEAVVDDAAADRGVPGLITAAAKAIARVRFDVDWNALDQIERAAEFDPTLPILLMHGTVDDTVPVGSSDAFAAAVPSVRYERFVGADHMYPWNTDPARYEAAVAEFLRSVLGEVAEAS